MKEVAKERLFEPAASIVERVMKDMLTPDDVNLPKMDNLSRAANHHRRQRPDDPVVRGKVSFLLYDEMIEISLKYIQSGLE